MAKKTNKTSHILDLITNGPSGESSGAQKPDIPASDKGREQITRATSSKKVTVVDETSRNDHLSGEILSSLTEELKGELKNSGRTPCLDPVPDCYFNQGLSAKEYTFVNIMERLLLRQDLDSYFKEYQVCTCKRCRADVYALTLSNLPAKYVVVSRDSLSLLLGYYENQFKIRIMTELIKACITIRDTPRHSLKTPELV